MELAKAYVQIVPSAEGITQNLEKELSGSADHVGRDFGKKFATGVAVAAGASVALGGKLIQSVVGSYADYEQLVGGIETLYKESSDKMMEYANNAYKTAGLSANEYMETSTSFAAALVSSLGGDTEKAADMANMAITDMSDNANKMGTDMEALQFAYNGFAKQNYTMLDNLKLGYGGTQEEMKRLLADAEAISGIHFDISSYSDVVQAIHIIQTEMDITGTTAKEAEATISGSIAMTKSAFSNLVAGLGDADADVNQLVKNVISSFALVVTNITPIVKNIADALPGAIDSAMDAIIPMLPQLVAMGVDVAIKLLLGITKSIPKIIAQGPNIIASFVKAIVGALPQVQQVGVQIVNGVWQGISNARAQFTANVKSFFSGIVNSVKSALGIHSPSTVFADSVGKWIPAGIAAGITGNGDVIDDALNDVMHGGKLSATASISAVSSGFAGQLNGVQTAGNATVNVTINYNGTGNEDIDAKRMGRLFGVEVGKQMRGRGLVTV